MVFLNTQIYVTAAIYIAQKLSTTALHSVFYSALSVTADSGKSRQLVGLIKFVTSYRLFEDLQYEAPPNFSVPVRRKLFS